MSDSIQALAKHFLLVMIYFLKFSSLGVSIIKIRSISYF